MISKQSGTVRAEVNELIRLEWKGAKASGKKWDGSEWINNIREDQRKIVLNRERREEQEERSVIRRAGRSRV